MRVHFLRKIRMIFFEKTLRTVLVLFSIFFKIRNFFYLRSIRLKKITSQVLVSLCRGVIILAGKTRILVTWFSQYSGLKVQNFTIIDQL
jgi:hypothetical protein